MADILEQRIAALEQQNAQFRAFIKHTTALQFMLLDIMLAQGILPADPIQSQIEGLREEIRDVLNELTEGDSGA